MQFGGTSEFRAQIVCKLCANGVRKLCTRCVHVVHKCCVHVVYTLWTRCGLVRVNMCLIHTQVELAHESVTEGLQMNARISSYPTDGQILT